MNYVEPVMRQELEKYGWGGEGDMMFSGTITKQIPIFLLWLIVTSFKVVSFIPFQDALLEVAISTQNFYENNILFGFFLSPWILQHYWPDLLKLFFVDFPWAVN